MAPAGSPAALRVTAHATGRPRRACGVWARPAAPPRRRTYRTARFYACRAGSGAWRWRAGPLLR
eukprot:1756390-Prymnesium_polylepis.1